MALIPEFIDKPNVLGIGEIGLNKNSRNELKVLEMHVDLAARHDLLIHRERIHTHTVGSHHHQQTIDTTLGLISVESEEASLNVI